MGREILACPLIDDASEMVFIRALEFFGSTGVTNPQPAMIALANQRKYPVLVVEALHAVVWFEDHFDGKYLEQRSDFDPGQTDIDDRLNYINGVPYPAQAKTKKKKGKK